MAIISKQLKHNFKIFNIYFACIFRKNVSYKDEINTTNKKNNKNNKLYEKL